jgi:class 3 adenylate cyclase
MEALRLCLHATKLGLLNLHWLVLCPNCRAPSTDALTLSKLKSEAHCDTCRVKYDADLADSVEVRFSVHPSVRAARREVYCIGGPSNMPQVLAQLRLAPGEARNEPILLKPGVIRIRCYQAEGIYSLNVTDSAAANTSPRIDCYSTGLSIDAKELRAGEVQFSVTNNLIGEALVVIESETWRESAATATTVISLQDFRDLFPAEAVAPGEEISISSLTLLFTDLKGSTMLYNRVGDAQAFGLVQNHFRFLTEYIMRNYGGIYKTMGDAVMASFSRNIDAARAAVEMQKRWNGFMKEFGGENPLLLKVGIHQGQAIAINNNGRLDCFGTTVNIASHIQKVSVGGDIVVSEQVFDDPEVAKFIGSVSSGFSAERIECSLKGYADRKFKLVKLTAR